MDAREGHALTKVGVVTGWGDKAIVEVHVKYGGHDFHKGCEPQHEVWALVQQLPVGVHLEDSIKRSSPVGATVLAYACGS